MAYCAPIHFSQAKLFLHESRVSNISNHPFPETAARNILLFKDEREQQYLCNKHLTSSNALSENMSAMDPVAPLDCLSWMRREAAAIISRAVRKPSTPEKNEEIKCTHTPVSQKRNGFFHLADPNLRFPSFRFPPRPRLGPPHPTF